MINLAESAQELLEQLWIATAEEEQAGITLTAELPAGADELVQAGLAERAFGRLNLTPRGRPEAARAIRRHRLGERLLADILATEQGLIDEQACRLEHALVEGLDDSICTLLGHPSFCPHGKPIPPGDCCKEQRAEVERVIAPLRDLHAGEAGQIAYIQMGNPQRLQKLMAMGVLPGVPVTLLRASPSYVFQAGYSQFAVDDEIAEDIYVRLKRG